MLIGNDFVMLHVPKTGGEFLKDVLESTFPKGSFESAKKHGSANLLPPEHAGKPRFMLVRDPWAWYPSWYHYCNGTGRREAHRKRVREMNKMFTLASGDFTLGCTETLRRVFISREMMPADADGPPSDQDRSDIDAMRALPRPGDLGEGLLSAHTRRIKGHADDDRTTIGRLESMADDFMRFLDDIGVTPPAKLEHKLRGPAINKSAKVRPEEVFTPAMSEAVATGDRALIERFGYTVPEGLRAGSTPG